MARNADYQDLLKFIAIFAMITDHLGLYLFPEINEFRVIGRFAMPIFCFFAGYNFKNIIYFSILFAGSLLQAGSSIFIFGSFIEMNILIAIFLGQIYLYIFRNQLKDFTKGYIHFVALACMWPWTYKIIDYGSLSIAIMILGYMVKQGAFTHKMGGFIVAFTSIVHTIFNFYAFSNRDLILSTMIVGLIGILLSCNNFERNIGLNVRIITRHTMFIYCVHLMIIEIIWRY